MLGCVVTWESRNLRVPIHEDATFVVKGKDGPDTVVVKGELVTRRRAEGPAKTSLVGERIGTEGGDLEGVRLSVLRELLGSVGERTSVQPPFACDHGYDISVGDDVYVNFNTVILGCAPVTIGDRTQVASGVHLLAADHPNRTSAGSSGSWRAP